MESTSSIKCARTKVNRNKKDEIMPIANDKDRETAIRLPQEGKPLPESYKPHLFADSNRDYAELTKFAQQEGLGGYGIGRNYGR